MKYIDKMEYNKYKTYQKLSKNKRYKSHLSENYGHLRDLTDINVTIIQ